MLPERWAFRKDRDVYCRVLRARQENVTPVPMVSAAWAVAALALFLGWQFLTVHYNRGGNWTGLFLIGSDYAMPTELARGVYRFPGSGYDGEMYRVVAHDPFIERGYARFIDGPRERYDRILIPALAYLMAGGNQRWIDAAYIAITALFAFLGCFWLSRWAVVSMAHPAWGLAFLLIPATVISMDRITVDIALAALTVAFALYFKTNARWTFFVVLALACLTRETGFLLVSAACLFELLHWRFLRALLWAVAAVPALAWYVSVRRTLPEQSHFGLPVWFANKLGLGVFAEMLNPPHYPLAPALEWMARLGDVLALASVILAVVLGIAIACQTRLGNPLAAAALLFAGFIFVLTTPVYWNDVNGYGRFISPLLILVAFQSTSGSSRYAPWWLGLAPVALIDLRLGMQFVSQIEGVLRGLM